MAVQFESFNLGMNGRGANVTPRYTTRKYGHFLVLRKEGGAKCTDEEAEEILEAIREEMTEADEGFEKAMFHYRLIRKKTGLTSEGRPARSLGETILQPETISEGEEKAREWLEELDKRRNLVPVFRVEGHYRLQKANGSSVPVVGFSFGRGVFALNDLGSIVHFVAWFAFEDFVHNTPLEKKRMRGETN